MTPGFDDAALIQHIDVIRICHISKAVGDQNDRLSFSQCMDLSHDVVFTLHIDIGGGFIENIDRAVMEQRSRQGQALALTAGEVGCLFVQKGIQPFFASQEVGQIYLLQHLPESILSGIGPSHQKILPDGSLEQVALMADVSKVFHETCFADFAEGHTANDDRTGIVFISAHQNGSNGGLTAAGFADDSGKAAFRECHIHTVEDLPVCVIRKMQALTFDRAIRRNGLRFLLGFRQIQQAEDLIGSGHAIHGDMEKASQHPHGQEEIRCQQNDEDAAC